MKSGLLLTLLLCGFCIGADGIFFHRPGGVSFNPAAFSYKSCPPGWRRYRGHCYMLQKTPRDWADAERFCTSVNGNLATIQSRRDYLFLRSLILRETRQRISCWVGGYDEVKEGVWLWSDGSKFTFRGWGKGEPNNTNKGEGCMEINLNGLIFNDVPCAAKKPFICRKVA